MVEVQSPGTARLDASDKVREYAQAGIPEYWRVDRDRCAVEVNVLGGGVYEVAATVRPGEWLQSSTLAGLACLVDGLFD